VSQRLSGDQEGLWPRRARRSGSVATLRESPGLRPHYHSSAACRYIGDLAAARRPEGSDGRKKGKEISEGDLLHRPEPDWIDAMQGHTRRIRPRRSNGFPVRRPGRVASAAPSWRSGCGCRPSRPDREDFAAGSKTARGSVGERAAPWILSRLHVWVRVAGRVAGDRDGQRGVTAGGRIEEEDPAELLVDQARRDGREPFEVESFIVQELLSRPWSPLDRRTVVTARCGRKENRLVRRTRPGGIVGVRPRHFVQGQVGHRIR